MNCDKSLIVDNIVGNDLDRLHGYRARCISWAAVLLLWYYVIGY